MYQTHMAGAVTRAERAHNAAVSQAYMTAVLTRAKRVPKLETLLQRRLPINRPQPPEILQAMCDALAAAWGARKE